MSRRVPTKIAVPSVDVVSTTTASSEEASSATVVGKRLPLKPGDAVMAIWPGGHQWYNARVLNNIDKYEVEFDDKTRHVLDPQFVAAVATPEGGLKRGPKPGARKKSTSPARVRKSRSKSPARRTEKGPQKRSTSTSRKVVPAADKADGSKSAEITTTEAVPKSPTRRRSKKAAAISPSQFGGEHAIGSVAAASSSKSQPHVVAAAATSSSLSSDTVLRGGVRQRSVGMTAKVAALQTARVAGVVTPGLISEGVALDKSPTSSQPTKNLTTGHHSQRHFFGPFGATVMTFLLPPLVLATYLTCNTERCGLFKLELPRRIDNYVDGQAIAIFLGWLSFQALLYALPIGRLVNGELLWDGTRLQYRMNGPLAFVLSMGAVAGALYYDDGIADTILDQLFPMAVTALAFSYALSLLLYLRSRNLTAYELNKQMARNEPQFFYDFFMGRELNPRPLGFELKMFLELRPGLIGWAALNVLILWKDYVSSAGQMSPSLIVSVFAQLLYVFDSLWFEEALLTTMDVTTEGLGFMLVFGDLVFVPAVFSIASRFLLIERRIVPVLSWYCIVAITSLSVVGYIIFRASNRQKDDFRREPFAVPYLETISTGSVKKILVSGWWGWVRHPNYFGDLLIALSFCLPAGFGSPVPYVYFIYLLVLLVHRACRDDDFCRQKYGAAWDEYTSRVRYRILKYVF